MSARDKTHSRVEQRLHGCLQRAAGAESGKGAEHFFAAEHLSMIRQLVGRRLASSASWLKRQGKDEFVQEAREQGLRSRAALKLVQINRSFRLLAPGMSVVDLGCAPGGWSQVASRAVEGEGGFVCDLRAPAEEASPTLGPPRPRTVSVFAIPSLTIPTSVDSEPASVDRPSVTAKRRPKRARPLTEDAASGLLDSEGSDDDELLPRQRYRLMEHGVAGPEMRLSAEALEARLGAIPSSKGLVLGIDLLGVAPIPGAVVLRGDFLEPHVREWVSRLLLSRGGLCDVVLSDMAHQFHGYSDIDTLKQAELATAAVSFACGAGGALRRGGHLVVKVRSTGDARVRAMIQRLSKAFARCVVEKPAASRSDSSEAFIVACGYHGRPIVE
jgi:23S rRNA U2552 (ribose-2'-O)-methylase RlmE/FtsJ